jgi:hypothetical protein
VWHHPIEEYHFLLPGAQQEPSIIKESNHVFASFILKLKWQLGVMDAIP